MTVTAPPPVDLPAAAAPRRAQWSVALHGVRRGALIVSLLSAGLSALVAEQYRQTFKDALDARSLTALAESPAIRALFGAARGLDDPGGFTVWRTGTFVAIILGAWGLLAATRITRGEEESGRWALLLVAPVTLRSTVMRHLCVLFGAVLLAAVLLSAAMIASGTAVVGSLVYGAGIGLVAAFFTALGALTAQLLPDRRAAAGAAAGVLVASLMVRMIADAVGALRWLSWISPLGLLGELHAYTGDRLTPLPVLAVGVVAVSVAALRVAGTRDLGDSPVRLSETHPARTALLASLPRFLARRTTRPLRWWAVGVGSYFLLIGLLAQSMVDFLADNPKFAEMAAQAGFSGLGTTRGYVASLFSLLAVPLGLFATSRVAGDLHDEEARRLTAIFAGPLSRRRWAYSQAGVVLLAVVVLAAAAAFLTWIGTLLVGAELSLGAALAGAENTVPVAALGLGAALLALGWAPRLVTVVGSLPGVGGFLLLTLSDSFAWPRAVRDVSPFAHLSAVPAVAPDLVASAVMVTVAVVLAAVGAAGYARRDLRG